MLKGMGIHTTTEHTRTHTHTHVVSPPLGNVDRLNNPGDLIDKGDGASDMIEAGDVSNLLPRHQHVLQKLQHRMRHVLEGPRGGEGGGIRVEYKRAGSHLPQIDSLVISELPVGHVAMIADDLPHMLGWHVLLLRLHKPKLPLLAVSLGLQLLPFPGCKETTRPFTLNRVNTTC